MSNRLRFGFTLQDYYGAEVRLSRALEQIGIAFSPVVVSGDVATPGYFNLPDQTPVTTERVTYTAAGKPTQDTYTGVTLWNLLNQAGGATVSTAKNDILTKFVIATGADGYQVAFSLGEIDPKFGNQKVLVAYADKAGQLGPNGSDGLSRMVVPGDHAGGRYVSELVSLTVGSLPEPGPGGSGGTSPAFRLDGQVTDAETYTPVTLASLHESITEQATYLSGAGQVTDTYTGVPLWSLIQRAGVLTDPAIKNDILGFGVVATGSDGYRALISMGEIDPAFGDQPDIVAYADTEGQLGSQGADGATRLVLPGDSAGGRYVSNLVSLQVVDLATLVHSA